MADITYIPTDEGWLYCLTLASSSTLTAASNTPPALTISVCPAFISARVCPRKGDPYNNAVAENFFS
ncbi:MAG: glycoside hydrolase family 32 protein [Oscillospiraceae bacterium]|nr:glycoside hydrolase family 32 protein [Oscillospiraceae bacterium]